MSNLRIGLYDFFAYTIPGGVYLFVLSYVLVRVQIVQIIPYAVTNCAFSKR